MVCVGWVTWQHARSEQQGVVGGRVARVCVTPTHTLPSEAVGHRLQRPNCSNQPVEHTLHATPS